MMILILFLIFICYFAAVLTVLSVRMNRNFFVKIPDGYLKTTYLRAFLFLSPKFEDWK